MALRLGVGDTFTICKGVVDVCSRASHDKPKEIQCIITEMELIRAHLKALDTKIGDEKSFASARSDISPVIKRSLEPIHRDLSQMRDFLHEHNRRQSVHVLDQVQYLAFYRDRLEGFRDKLDFHRTSISVIGDLIEDQNPAERRKSIMKLDALVEEHERRPQKLQISVQDEELLKNLEQQLPSADIAPHLSSDGIPKDLDDNLIAEGLSSQQSEGALFPITRALSPQPYLLGTVPISLMPKPVFRLDVFATGTHHDDHELENIDVDDKDTVS